jgi:hypothetical protein
MADARGQTYDELGNPIRPEDVRGKVLGGKCGMLACGETVANYVYDHPERGQMFVCSWCAGRINGWAKQSIFGSGAPDPCRPAPLSEPTI